jgi:hypothetical protein
MALDPQIALGTAMIILPIVAQNFRIEGEKTQTLVVDAIIRPLYRKLITDMLTAIPFGYSVGEKVWDRAPLKITTTNEFGKEVVVHDRDTVFLKKVKYPSPKTIVIIRDKKTEDIKYVTQERSLLLGVKPKKVPISKCVWFAPDAKFGNVFGLSRYKPVYQAWYWYLILIQFMLKYLERRGGPTTLAKVPKGTTIDASGRKRDNMDLGLEMANSVSGNSCVAVSSEVYRDTNVPKWNIDTIEDSQRGEMFLDALSFLNTQKFRALQLPDKVGVAEGSSTNATAENNTDIHLLDEEALIQKLEDTINNQVIPDIIEYNFMPEERRPCTIKIERLNHGKRTLLKEVLLRMIMFSSSVGDNKKPVTMPSMKKISEFLEVPLDEFDKMFMDSGEDFSEGGTMTPDAKEDAKTENNAKALPQKKRTSRERKSKTRYQED